MMFGGLSGLRSLLISDVLTVFHREAVYSDDIHMSKHRRRTLW